MVRIFTIKSIKIVILVYILKILLFVILYLNHNALTIAAKVNGNPRIVRPASRFIIKSPFAGLI